jgi:hypothetical protein
MVPTAVASGFLRARASPVCPRSGHIVNWMNVFDLRQRLVSHYARYTQSFIKIADPTILAEVESELEAGAFWLEPLLQLNPTFLPGAHRFPAYGLRTAAHGQSPQGVSS